ncbi:hypothetical protein [Streptomyces sp. NPDC058157]|uniref:hypothetical protein n=1 Tax=Streptomyces sp. NPDC058157 TaxID=3346360 RepID=UPI0036E4D6E9
MKENRGHQAEKEGHEDGALNALVQALTARGHRAAITATPDRDPDHPLTVESILTVDGIDWVAEHMLLTRDNRLPSATATTTKALQGKLETIAAVHGCALNVCVLPQRRGEAQERPYFDEVETLARDAAATGAQRFAEDGFTSVQPLCWPPGMVFLSFWETITGNPSLAEQIREGAGAAVEKKLTKQLKSAKDVGYPVMLILDQHMGPKDKTGTVFSVTQPAATVLSAVQPYLDKYPGVVDLLWLRPPGTDVLQLLRGELPTPESAT